MLKELLPKTVLLHKEFVQNNQTQNKEITKFNSTKVTSSSMPQD